MSLFQSKEKDGTVNILVNGYLTKDPYVVERDGKPLIVTFSVCYGKKKYMDCKVWAGNEKLFDLVRCLEHYDVVSASGVYGTRVGKDGKEYGQIEVDYISVLQQPPASDDADSSSTGNAEDGGDFKEIEEEEDAGGQLPF